MLIKELENITESIRCECVKLNIPEKNILDAFVDLQYDPYVKVTVHHNNKKHYLHLYVADNSTVDVMSDDETIYVIEDEDARLIDYFTNEDKAKEYIKTEYSRNEGHRLVEYKLDINGDYYLVINMKQCQGRFRKFEVIDIVPSLEEAENIVELKDDDVTNMTKIVRYSRVSVRYTGEL